MRNVNKRVPCWEHFAHGADIGVRGVGSTVAEAFEQTALALTAVVTEPSRIASLRSIALPDRELACAPIDSPEGRHYLGAMRAAANYAWCNRQLLMWQAREVFATVFGTPAQLGMEALTSIYVSMGVTSGQYLGAGETR